MAAAVEPNYWVDPADADRKGFWIFGHLLLITIAGMLIAFLVWADNAVLDIVTRGQGKVIPSSTVQMIQNLEGGIMADEFKRASGDPVSRREKAEAVLVEQQLRDQLKAGEE